MTAKGIAGIWQEPTQSLEKSGGRKVSPVDRDYLTSNIDHVVAILSSVNADRDADLDLVWGHRLRNSVQILIALLDELQRHETDKILRIDSLPAPLVDRAG